MSPRSIGLAVLMTSCLFVGCAPSAPQSPTGDGSTGAEGTDGDATSDDATSGDATSGDATTGDTTMGACGNGVLDPGEECEDANDDDTDTCAQCRTATCGDGFIWAGIEECDDGASNGDGTSACTSACKTNVCGDGYHHQPSEECEDGNTVDNDGCNANCAIKKVTQVAAWGAHTCALLDSGAVRCWGWGGDGQLGYGNTNDIGDDETPASAGDVDVGGTVTQLTAGGGEHTCALLDSVAVRCWGYGGWGQLGYGNTNDIGDDETPSSAGDVDVGGTVIQLAAGGDYTCALLERGGVRCWGQGGNGQLGYGNVDDIGDDETPASAGDVDVGGTVTQLTAGRHHTCALLDSGGVRCWGWGGLGYGNTNIIGDDETPASAGDVDVGGSGIQLSAGAYHTCALLDSGAVRCWGCGGTGQLGYGNTNDIGDDETPASAGDVDVGGTVTQLGAGGEHTCALLDSGAVRCWGEGAFGELGYGNTNSVGDDETPESAGDVQVF